MKRKLTMITMVISLMIIIAACAGNDQDNKPNDGPTLEITHDLDTTVVNVNPSNIVVFDFGVLETLDVLDIPVLGVAKNSLPAHLSQYDSSEYKNIGSLKEPDFEGIYAMKPELIIISGRQIDLYDELSDIAPTIFMGVDQADYMNSFRHNVTLLGEIFEKEDEVAQHLSEIDEAIEALVAITSSTEEKGLVTLVSGCKVSAFGPNSRFGLIHDVFGVKAADSGIEVSTHGMSVGFEYIANINPDYLFVVDRDAVVEGALDSPAKEVIENALVKNTNAYKNDKIIYLDPNYWYLSGGGLISVTEMIEQVKSGLQ